MVKESLKGASRKAKKRPKAGNPTFGQLAQLPTSYLTSTFCLQPLLQHSAVSLQHSLESHLDPELHLPLDGAAERAGRAREHRRDRAVGGVADGRVRVAELRVIQQVERLDAELGLDVPDLRVLDERRIDV